MSAYEHLLGVYFVENDPLMDRKGNSDFKRKISIDKFNEIAEK